MSKWLGILAAAFCLLGAGNAHAIIDTGPAVNGTPSQFAIYALEDIFTYKASEREAHLSRVKEDYFTAEGWRSFEANIAKPNSSFSGSTQRDLLSVYEYWETPNDSRDDYGPNTSKKENISDEFIDEFMLISMEPDDRPKNPMKVKGKHISRTLIKIKIQGTRDAKKKYGSHYIQGAPAYNYKIDSIEFIKREDQ